MGALAKTKHGECRLIHIGQMLFRIKESHPDGGTGEEIREAAFSFLQGLPGFLATGNVVNGVINDRLPIVFEDADGGFRRKF